MYYKLSPNLHLIRNLVGYYQDEDVFSPKYSHYLGLYNSIKSSLFLLDAEEYLVYDLLLNSKKKKFSLSEIDAIDKNMTTFKGFTKILHSFIDLGIIIKSDTIQSLSKDIKFNEAEIYIGATEGCNFACAGCATSVDLIPADKARTLSIDILEKYLVSFFRSCKEKQFKKAHIKWAGGEPLLEKSFKLIKNGQKIIKKLASKYQVDCHQTILTNGVYLNEEKIVFAKKNKMHVSLSLWGTAEYQDKLRRPRNNSQTYQHLVGRIKDLSHSGVSFNINYVLTPQNSEDFPLFIETMWNINSSNFIGKDWDIKKPLPLGINFFRPQTALQIAVMKKGYRTMIKGLRAGFSKINDMIEDGIKLQPLNKIDYLDLFKLLPTTCGSGFIYVAINSDGVANCHQGLYDLKDNRDRIFEGENMFDVVLDQYENKIEKLLASNISYENKNLKSDILRYHGGAGCPRLAQKENNNELGHVASTSWLYEQIFEELLSLETKRQLRK
ncbi:MAG: radical SAM protein [Pseudomonadales bacterium]|nr:radical SAM protein [Pseudomonadales bacterium]